MRKQPGRHDRCAHDARNATCTANRGGAGRRSRIIAAAPGRARLQLTPAAMGVG